MINDFKQEKDSLQLQTIAPKEFLSFKEAAVYLKISESNLYKKTSKRVLKFFKPNNGKLYFKRCDLDAWVLKGECKSIDVLEKEVTNFLKEGKRHGKKIV